MDPWCLSRNHCFGSIMVVDEGGGEDRSHTNIFPRDVPMMQLLLLGVALEEENVMQVEDPREEVLWVVVGGVATKVPTLDPFFK